MTETVLDYPAWLRIDHWLNVLFLTLLLRSGIEILSTHPKLYWHDDSKPGTEWARFTTKKMPTDKLYDTLDEEEDYSPLHPAVRHRPMAPVLAPLLVDLRGGMERPRRLSDVQSAAMPEQYPTPALLHTMTWEKFGVCVAG
jgi:hypothetical protein